MLQLIYALKKHNTKEERETQKKLRELAREEREIEEKG
jgi:hypothetical protein